MKFNFSSTKNYATSNPSVYSKVRWPIFSEKRSVFTFFLLILLMSLTAAAQTGRIGAPVEPPAISEQPVSATACFAATISFTAKTTNAANHQWQVDQGSGFTDIDDKAPYSGVKTQTLTITGVTAEMYKYVYRVVATGAESSQAISNSVSVGVPTLQFNTHPASTTVCTTSNATFTATSTGAVSHKWQVKTGGSFVDITVAPPYSVNSTSSGSTLTITAPSTTMNGYKYRCVISNCGEVNSNEATLTVTSVGQWLGTIDNEWKTEGNWGCSTVPTASTDVVINGVTGLPEINGIGYNAFCNNLTISGGAKLYVNEGTLKIKGAVNAAPADFVRLAATSFSGDSQVIPAGDYGDLQMEGTGQMTLAGNVNVSQILILGGGRIALGNYDLTVEVLGEMNHDMEGSHVVTNGTGQLKKKGLGATVVMFPVGTADGSYTPLSISNAGTSDVFGVRVVTGVYDAYIGDVPTGSLLATNNVNKTWFVTEGNEGGSNATLAFNWNDPEQQSQFDPEACFGAHYTGGKWVAGTTGNAPLGDFYSISLAGVTTFSPFGVGSTGSALPLKLVSFNAVSNTEGVSLTWKTVDEVNTTGFDIEASKDAVQFKKVGFVNSLDKNSAVASDYYFNTPHLTGTPVSYFRLKMLDQDGSFSYSKIVGVRQDGALAGYQVFPNPVNNEDLSIKSLTKKAGDVAITISDMRGVVLYQSTVNGASLDQNSLVIPTKRLSHGANYVIKIAEAETGNKQSFKIFKK